MLQEGQRRGRWGRKLDLVTLDDGYSPPKTVERVRRLVGQDEVLRVSQTLGTPSDSAIHARMNGKKLPQTVPLQGSGANVFFDIATPKFAAQAIRKACDTIWKPTQYVANVSVSVATVPTPAGLDKSVGLLSSIYGKDRPTRAGTTTRDERVARVHEEGLPDGSLTDAADVYGCGAARTLVQVLKQCGDNLTRDNRTKQAADLKDFDTGVALPGIRIDTGPADYAPIESVQPVRFDGETWVPLGEVMGR